MPAPDPTSQFSAQVKAHVFQGGRVRSVPPHLPLLREATLQGGFVWADIPGKSSSPQLSADLLLAQDAFDLHPLAIEDALQARQRAKVEPYSDFWFVVIRSASLAQGEESSPGNPAPHLALHETALFIGERFVLSVRHDPAFTSEDIVGRWENVPEGWRAASSSLVYVIIDALVDSFEPLVDSLSEQLRAIRQTLSTERALKPHTCSVFFGWKRWRRKLTAWPCRCAT